MIDAIARNGFIFMFKRFRIKGRWVVYGDGSTLAKQYGMRSPKVVI
jgi:hypothetical protein